MRVRRRTNNAKQFKQGAGRRKKESTEAAPASGPPARETTEKVA